MADIDGAMAQHERANETPPPATWRLGSFVVAGGLAVSTVVHMVLFGTVLIVTPRLLGPAPVSSMTVDIMTPEEVAELSKVAEPSTPQQPASDKPAQPSLSQSPSVAPTSPQPVAPPPQAAPASSSMPVDPYAIPAAPAPPQVASATPSPPVGEATRLAQLLGLPAPMAGAVASGGPSEYKANLTGDEITAFAAHVQSCWTSPAGVGNDPKLYLVIRVGLRRDGSLASIPEVMGGSGAASETVRMTLLAMKQSAFSALQHCPAYSDLPAEKYDEWRLLDLRFTPSGISTASPVTNDSHSPRRPG
ncbi:MAG TPA: hypothetical protein VGH49_10885 [Xanthobacteraceae bacterium]